MSLAPLIVTLRLDAVAHERLNTLRRAHFPPERNVLPAHLTLFHHLPGEAEADILNELRTLARRPTMPLTVEAPFSLGRGVALRIASPKLVALRAELLHWLDEHHPDEITAQDRQGFRPDVTVQNKVDPADARSLLDELADGFTPWAAIGEGLQLWRYLGGPWETAGEATFSS